MKWGSFWERWSRGTNWSWVDERYRDRLPSGLGANVMELDARDRLHRKQGRSTARVVFHPDCSSVAASGAAPSRPLSVYLKRHERAPLGVRLAATFLPAPARVAGQKRGRSPASVEWAHLEEARALGLDVPEVVAAGEWIGPRARLRGYLMVAELNGCEALNEALPALAERLGPRAFRRVKRRAIAEMARATAALHASRRFHKDLYLCHFFLETESALAAGEKDGAAPRVALIDLHRMREHRWFCDWWRWKDLGQLLFSTFGVAGIEPGDLRRFWREYQRRTRPRLRLPRWQEWFIGLRAARYERHNRNQR